MPSVPELIVPTGMLLVRFAKPQPWPFTELVVLKSYALFTERAPLISSAFIRAGLFVHASFVVKNSWGEISDNKGFVYVSEAYMRLNTISFTLHKSAIPQDLRRRLGLEPGEANIERPRTPAMDLQPANGTKKPAQTVKIQPAKKTGDVKQ